MAKKAAGAAPAFTAELLALIKERDAILLRMKPDADREMEIRKQLASALFPKPEEGSQRLITADGFEVILTHKVNRKLDEALVDSVMLELPEGCPARELGNLIAYPPKLVMDGYRALPADQLAIVQQMVTETDGAPELKIEPIAQPDPQDIAEMQQGGGDPSGRGKGGKKAPAKAKTKKKK
jgi:hypothetical protein